MSDSVIRSATETDIPRLLEMGKRFIDIAWSRIDVPYDEQSCTELLKGLIADHICLVPEDLSAMIGVIVHPWHFNRNVLTATELFWWTDPGSSAGRLLREKAELAARNLGARTINMACEHHMRSAALERLYRMNGYIPSEHIFIKELS